MEKDLKKRRETKVIETLGYGFLTCLFLGSLGVLFWLGPGAAMATFFLGMALLIMIAMALHDARDIFMGKGDKDQKDGN